MGTIQVWLWRWDRDPDDHHYGGPIDALLDELADGAERLDRTVELPEHPAATMKDSDIGFELHEDGVIFQVLIEQIPAFISAATGLLVAWHTFKPKVEPTARASRSVRLTVAGHTYEGEPSPKELGEILDVFKGFDIKRSAKDRERNGSQ